MSKANGATGYQMVSKRPEVHFNTGDPEKLNLMENGETRKRISGHLENNNEGVEFESSGSWQRTITKKGTFTSVHKNIARSGWPFFSDIFTTMVDVRWRHVLLVFCCAYFGTWLLFAGLWYVILYFHGDFEESNMADPKWKPCVGDLKDFTAAFLFSVETQHTTGYGFYHLTEECSAAIVTFCFQSIVGCLLEGLLVGLVFVKLTRGKKRTATIMFSRVAVISRRDGYLCLMFRLADMRNRSNLLQATIRAQLISKRVTAEGEELNMSRQELDVCGDGERRNEVLLFWPTTVIHRITPSSPLYRLSLAELTRETADFEIIVVLEGIVEATGLSTQARSSYVPSEIRWGHRFVGLTSSPKLSTAKSKADERIIDYTNFHDTIPTPTSGHSAFQLDLDELPPDLPIRESVA